jgi:hypothetical protein
MNNKKQAYLEFFDINKKANTNRPVNNYKNAISVREIWYK